ncbi:ribonuclease E inhibitor RraB [Aurantiacibacter odishensis]|uniref:ribonuclease E inhibitor RraB n=1 Tax=Aurantiacibacter odishensis TaxID=1155476 RepID=UPI0013C42CC2|nr:ribonuclease E inhibitor RraB [Aurantiacibacter odishensis]
MRTELIPADKAVLSSLREGGDHPAIPREIRIWIYGSQDDLNKVADRLADNWDDTIPERDGEEWSILASRTQPTSDEAIIAMTNEIEAALEGTAADYDGWETSIEKPQ